MQVSDCTPHITLFTVNRFNPYLADGVSNSMLEVFLFLKRQNCGVSIVTFLTDESYKKRVFEYLTRSPDTENVVRNGWVCEAIFRKVPIYMEITPYKEVEIWSNYQSLLKRVMEKLGSQHVDYIFTLEDDLISLLAAYLLDIPGAHFFRSLAYVHTFTKAPLFNKILRKRRPFSASRFLQKKVKELLNLDSVVWRPIINVERYLNISKAGEGEGIGFYSAGWHKGDDIVNSLIERMPQYRFLVVGRNYSPRFKKIPKNLEYMGDVTDIKGFYSNVKILLVPSLVEEVFPRVILEAAINGIPVIANRVGGIPEAMGDSGILVDVDFERLKEDKDAEIERLASEYTYHISRLMKDKAEYEHYRQKALRRAREYLEEQKANSLYIYENYIKPYLS